MPKTRHGRECGKEKFFKFKPKTYSGRTQAIRSRTFSPTPSPMQQIPSCAKPPTFKTSPFRGPLAWSQSDNKPQCVTSIPTIRTRGRGAALISCGDIQENPWPGLNPSSLVTILSATLLDLGLLQHFTWEIWELDSPLNTNCPTTAIDVLCEVCHTKFTLRTSLAPLFQHITRCEHLTHATCETEEHRTFMVIAPRTVRGSSLLSQGDVEPNPGPIGPQKDLSKKQSSTNFSPTTIKFFLNLCPSSLLLLAALSPVLMPFPHHTTPSSHWAGQPPKMRSLVPGAILLQFG